MLRLLIFPKICGQLLFLFVITDSFLLVDSVHFVPALFSQRRKYELKGQMSNSGAC